MVKVSGWNVSEESEKLITTNLLDLLSLQFLRALSEGCSGRWCVA